MGEVASLSTAEDAPGEVGRSNVSRCVRAKNGEEDWTVRPGEEDEAVVESAARTRRDHVSHDSRMLLLSTQAKLTQNATLCPSLRLYLRGVLHADRVLEVVCRVGRWRRFGMQAVRDIAEHRVRGLETVNERLSVAPVPGRVSYRGKQTAHPRSPTLCLAARDQLRHLSRPLLGLAHPLVRYCAR